MQELLKMALDAVTKDKNIIKSFATTVVGLTKDVQSQSLTVKHAGSSKESVINAGLIIACDGVNSGIRKMLDVGAKTTDYKQDAIVFDIQTELAHSNTAFERFMSDGVLAVLPKTENTMGCVWTVDRCDSKAQLDMSDIDFETSIQERFGYRLGQIKIISKPALFPLYLVQADKMYQDNVLFFGNALHFLHPVSGQGLNLSVRDIGCLYDLLDGKELSQNYLSSKLESFDETRKSDHDRTIAVTHGFVKWFVSEDAKKIISRNIGLHLLQRSKFAKKVLSRVMMGKLSKGSTLMRKVVE
jgi:2-octaprenyl-6-methoxyphenol hydroxylase